MSRLIALIALASFSLAGNPALAAPVELDLPGTPERTHVSYTCSDDVARSAEYINIGDNSLAIVEIDGAPVVFVTVIAASGARYAARQYVWWTKGREVTLTNEMAAEGATPITCREAGN